MMRIRKLAICSLTLSGILMGSWGVTDETDVPSRRRAGSATGALPRCHSKNEGPRRRISADLAPVRLSSGGDRASRALYPGDHARPLSTERGHARIDCGLHFQPK